MSLFKLTMVLSETLGSLRAKGNPDLRIPELDGVATSCFVIPDTVGKNGHLNGLI